MGTTANNAWPYPESTDFVADGATAIENLADAIDADLGDTSLLPRGVVTATGGGTGGKGWAKYIFNVAFTGGVATDFPGLTVTFTADPSRVYRTTGMVPDIAFPNSGDQFQFIIADGTNAVLNSNYLDGSRSVQDATMTVFHVESGISGTQTRKLRGNASTSTNVFASSSYYQLIIVEDIGAA